MPYMLVGNCVHKQNADGSAGETIPGGCHDTPEEAKKHMRAMYANVKDSAIVEMSMRITKASYNKSEDRPMKWVAIDSDTDEDLYQERMSMELYKDMVSRIENKTPIPDTFQEAICETDWCGGMPYLSIAHYKAGTGRMNVPGDVESVFIDGTRLKSKGILHDTPMGLKVWDALRHDLYMEKSGNEDHQPVRISIGFLDLEHKHLAESGGQEYTFTRNNPGEICPLCAQGIGGKIYMKGQLVHLAMTRVPVNPRTAMEVERSMEESIKTRKDDAASIVGELADSLEEKSIASDVLVVRADEQGSMPEHDMMELCEECYDPNTDSYDQECVDRVMQKYVGRPREDATVKSKALFDVVEKFFVEEAKRRKDVSEADKKRAEKEYGDVQYADETNKKYPIDTEEHIRAAWNYIHQKRNAAKYPDNGAAIKKKIVAAWKKKIGGAPPSASEKSTVEESMDATNVADNQEVEEKGVLGIPEKKFEYQGVSGDGNNNVPSPVKAKKDEEAGSEDEAGDEMEKSFAALRNLVRAHGSVDEINKAFNSLGTAVETSYAEQKSQAGLDMAAIAEIVRSAVQQAVQPLQLEIAALKSQKATPTEPVVKSKALTLSGYPRPEDMIQRAAPQPQRKLSQIEQLAYRSTGAIRE